MISLIWYILILGLIVAIHEFGHFSVAKFFKIYVYEFSIGMGKKIFGRKKKGSETEFCIRAIPLGGYVMIAGEDVQDEKIPKDRQMCNKGFWPRFLVLLAGPFMNFVLTFVFILLGAFIYGSISIKPVVGDITDGYPAQEVGLEKGDSILSVNGKRVWSWDRVKLIFAVNNGKELTFDVKKVDGSKASYKIKPILDDDKSYKYGFKMDDTKRRGFFVSIEYAFQKTASLFQSMFDTLKLLFTGGVGINQLSGPVGIYNVVDAQAKMGFEAILELVAYLSINVGVINLIPFPAFDGGRILFLFIEKIFRKPVSKKVENIIHTIGFVLLIGLLIFVTVNDLFHVF